MWGGMGRCGEVWGDVGRYGEVVVVCGEHGHLVRRARERERDVVSAALQHDDRVVGRREGRGPVRHRPPG